PLVEPLGARASGRCAGARWAIGGTRPVARASDDRPLGDPAGEDAQQPDRRGRTTARPGALRPAHPVRRGLQGVVKAKASLAVALAVSCMSCKRLSREDATMAEGGLPPGAVLVVSADPEVPPPSPALRSSAPAFAVPMAPPIQLAPLSFAA